MLLKKILHFCITSAFCLRIIFAQDENQDKSVSVELENEANEMKWKSKEPLLKINTRIPSKNCHTTAAFGDVLKIHYSVRENDRSGRLFDASKKRKTAYEFQLGVDDVVKAYDLGLLGVCHGETRELTAPPHLAYGTVGHPRAGIPPNATLLFTVEILEIRKNQKIPLNPKKARKTEL